MVLVIHAPLAIEHGSRGHASSLDCLKAIALRVTCRQFEVMVPTAITDEPPVGELIPYQSQRSPRVGTRSGSVLQ